MSRLFYRIIWDLCDDLYFLTGLRWQAPIEYVFPEFGPWLFHKMLGIQPGKRIK